MKFLITTESFYPQKNGISHVVQNIVYFLKSKGHEVIIATMKLDDKSIRTREDGVKIAEFNIKRNRFGNYVGENEKYIDFIKSCNVDVMINECVQTWTTDLILPILTELNCIKILHSHGYSGLDLKPINPFMKYWFHKYYKVLHTYLKNYDHIIYLSNILEDKKYGDRYNINHFSIIGNGVSKHFYKESYNNNILTNYNIEENYLVSVGNFSKYKNQKFLIESFYQVDNHSYSLVLIGNGDEYMKLMIQLKNKLDKKYGFRKVIFLSNIEVENIATIVRFASVFVYGSKREAYPLVILESMSLGVPFITTNIGNVKELPGGIIVDSQKEMVKRINDLLQNKEFSIKLGKEGSEYVKHNCDWQDITQRFIDIAINIKEGKL